MIPDARLASHNSPAAWSRWDQLRANHFNNLALLDSDFDSLFSSQLDEVVDSYVPRTEGPQQIKEAGHGW